MAKKWRLDFWKSDGFVGLLVSGVVLAVGATGGLQGLERKAYDIGVGFSAREASDRIALIAIDKQSIDNIGRWPWSREVFADMIDRLAQAEAKTIGTTVLLSEPQRDAGLGYVERLIELNNARLGAERAERAARTDAIARAAARGAVATKVGPGDTATGALSLDMPAADDPLARLLAEAEDKLNTDRRLAGALERAGNVVLPLLLRIGDPAGRPDRLLPEFVAAHAVRALHADARPLPALAIDAGVIDTLGRHAAAVGHLNALPDADGALRDEVLLLDYHGQVVPALSLSIAAHSLNLTSRDIAVRAPDLVQLGRLRIATDPALRMRPFFYTARDGAPAFVADSFFDVLTGKIPPEKYRDKIVLIGPTAAGIGSFFVTPAAPSMASVEVLAHAVSSLLSEHFFVAPPWAHWAETGAFALVALYLIFLLPRLSAGMGAALTLGLLLALLLAHFGMMITQAMWLQLMTAATLLLVGHLLLTTKRFLVTERGKEKSEAESAESNRMLGLAFQGQGQLDMAFDKFRKCPLDDALMENLYNLGLDFERKRQFNKAEAVFRYMADFDPKFRDLEQRLTRARQMSETVILGGAGAHPGGGMVIGAGAEKPMLGRYQIEKELGKGAMGVVYLGRDPKINRVVAIKTLALSQEFDEDELKDVKERFFREAETAGRLNHPNIVTMFDAGEEHDLAYIAMEFLKGRDLVPHTRPDNLLPLPQVLDIVARVAEALDYAHANNVVHRDIKPANIMYAPEAEQIKVTDFGIARITDSSKTRTGMVLGTPSYMSPEQLAGKKIDGRSDLFSLGVMFYQLCCGQLPFVGESMAQLMFKIASEPPPDIRTLRPGMHDCVAKIINKALVKDPDQRYQRGADLARHVRICLSAMETTGRAGGA